MDVVPIYLTRAVGLLHRWKIMRAPKVSLLRHLLDKNVVLKMSYAKAGSKGCALLVF